MPLVSGTRLGPYEILSSLGAGGMGEVYRARDTRLDRTVAIKVLATEVADDPDLQARFEGEARAIAALDHPHICAIHDVGQHEGIQFLVMQYLEGETLAARLAHSPSGLPLPQALKIGVEIADALDKTHRAGITHRDLKPANVMLTRSGAKLLDFGLAKLRPAAPISMSGLTRLGPTTGGTASGTILGTVHYMAPEQVEGRDADTRSDIWALGAVLYEMVTGTRPFTGESTASVIGSILKDEPKGISARQPLAPAALDHLVERCLAKDREERWQSARDIRTQLDWIAARPLAGSQELPPPRRLQIRRWSLAATVLAAVLVGALFYVGWLPRGVPADGARTSLVRFDVPTGPSDTPTSFALSPDGRQLVFAAKRDGDSILWVRDLDRTLVRSLPGTEQASFPFWSPDGRAVGFFADRKLKRLDLDGGSVRVLADAPNGRGGAWSTDGIIIYTPSNTLFQPDAALMQVPASGGAPLALTHLRRGEGSHRWPQFLPDGRRFLFFSTLGTIESEGMYLGSLDGGESVRVLVADSPAVFSSPGHLLFLRNDTLAVASFDAARRSVGQDLSVIADAVGRDRAVYHTAVSASGAGVIAYRESVATQRRQFVRFDRHGTQLATIGPPDDNALSGPNLDATGRRLVGWSFAAVKNSDLALFDLVRSTPSRFTFHPATDVAPVWSADGRRVFFTSARGGGMDIYVKPSDGATEETLLAQGMGYPLSSSSDGAFLLAQRTEARTARDLWAIPLNGSEKPFPIVATPADEGAGQFSPDGSWITYESNEVGRLEIFVRAFRGSSARWQISTAGGMMPRWSRDGSEVYFVAPDGQLMAAAIKRTGDVLMPGVPEALFAVRLATGAAILPGVPQYAVAPDGTFIVNTAVGDPPSSPITVVVNWDAALRRR